MSSRWLTFLAGVAGVIVAVATVAAAVLLPVGTDPPLTSPRTSAVARSLEPSQPVPGASPAGGSLGPGRTAAAQPPVVGLEVGQLAPDFELPTPDGKTIRLSELRGHPVWINFWAPWCLPCRTEMPRLEGLWLQHRAAGLIVLGVGVRDSREAFRAYASEVGVTYPLVVDLAGKVAQQYRALVLPVHYWLDSEGIVHEWAFGELPPDLLAAAVSRILAAPTPAP